jgi:signal transduction protein with GAF and PtsI domain
LRRHAQLVRAQTQLAGRLGRFGVARRLWHRRHLGMLSAQLADCRRHREQAERRLAVLEAKLQVIAATEQARTIWIAQAREVLVRGVAAARVLADQYPQHDAVVDAPRPAAGDGRGWPQAAS